MTVEITSIAPGPHPDGSPGGSPEAASGSGGPDYVSYSAFSDYVSCGEKYRLSRVKKVPRRPGWWFPGGTAVHGSSEEFDRLLFAEQGR